MPEVYDPPPRRGTASRSSMKRSLKEQKPYWPGLDMEGRLIVNLQRNNKKILEGPSNGETNEDPTHSLNNEKDITQFAAAATAAADDNTGISAEAINNFWSNRERERRLQQQQHPLQPHEENEIQSQSSSSMPSPTRSPSQLQRCPSQNKINRNVANSGSFRRRRKRKRDHEMLGPSDNEDKARKAELALERLMSMKTPPKEALQDHDREQQQQPHDANIAPSQDSAPRCNAATESSNEALITAGEATGKGMDLLADAGAETVAATTVATTADFSLHTSHLERLLRNQFSFVTCAISDLQKALMTMMSSSFVANAPQLSTTGSTSDSGIAEQNTQKSNQRQNEQIEQLQSLCERNEMVIVKMEKLHDSMTEEALKQQQQKDEAMDQLKTQLMLSRERSAELGRKLDESHEKIKLLQKELEQNDEEKREDLEFSSSLSLLKSRINEQFQQLRLKDEMIEAKEVEIKGLRDKISILQYESGSVSNRQVDEPRTSKPPCSSSFIRRDVIRKRDKPIDPIDSERIQHTKDDTTTGSRSTAFSGSANDYFHKTDLFPISRSKLRIAVPMGPPQYLIHVPKRSGSSSIKLNKKCEEWHRSRIKGRNTNNSSNKKYVFSQIEIHSP